MLSTLLARQITCKVTAHALCGPVKFSFNLITSDQTRLGQRPLFKLRTF